MLDETEMRGICHFHSETGTEGGYWAFQDERHIKPPDADHPHGQWSYEGLHVLKDGDHLTILDKENGNQVLWSGKIRLVNYPLFTQSAGGMWTHSDPEYVVGGWHWLIKILIPLTEFFSRHEFYASLEGIKKNDSMLKQDAEYFGKIKEFLSGISERLVKKRRTQWARWFFGEYPAKLTKGN